MAHDEIEDDETMTRPVRFLDAEDTDHLRVVAWAVPDESDDEW